MKPQHIPSLPPTFLSALGKTIDGVSADAAQKVTEHLSKHQFAKEGEAWVATGIQHIHDDSCPFCANSVKGNALIDLYRQYFDQAYKAFKAELAGLHTKVLQDLSEAEGIRTKTRFEELSKAVEYWSAFGKVDFSPVAALDTAPEKLSVLFAEAKKAIEAKIAAPLEPIDVSALEQAISEWQVAADAMKACNDSLVHTFQISSTKTNSAIEEWDLEREVKDGYLRAHMEMLDFHEGNSGTASEMLQKMRPLLEDYIRYRFPNQIPNDKWLGDMLAIIRADPNHPLQPVYQELDDINSFTAPHHHTNTSLNEDEVRTYVARTLAIVGGC